jgi:hypothetical protein
MAVGRVIDVDCEPEGWRFRVFRVFAELVAGQAVIAAHGVSGGSVREGAGISNAHCKGREKWIRIAAVQIAVAVGIGIAGICLSWKLFFLFRMSKLGL